MQRLVWAAMLLAMGSAARAEDDDAGKFFYFSSPGIGRDEALVDWDECRDLAGVVRPQPSGYIYTPNQGGAAGLAGAAAAGFVQGLISGAQRRHMIDAAIRKCMNVKGYTRYSMTKEEAQALYSGKWEQMRERLADKAVAPGPASARLEP